MRAADLAAIGKAMTKVVSARLILDETGERLSVRRDGQPLQRRSMKTRRTSFPGLPLLGALLLGAALLAWPPGGGARAQDDIEETLAGIRDELDALRGLAQSTDGRHIYRVACATCHGIEGGGQGPQGGGFEFRPTNFRRGVYKLRSTAFEALPRDADIVRSIREGMPGTEMVPFGEILSPRSIEAVAAYIKTFSPKFTDPDWMLLEEEMLDLPERRPFPRTAETVAAGRAVYEDQVCGSCHGDEGEGDGPDAEGMTDDWDVPITMLDWTRGVYKTGPTDGDLYRAIAAGFNGTPMFGYAEDLSEEEIWQLVDFIVSLREEPGWLDWLIVEEPSGLAYEKAKFTTAQAAADDESDEDEADDGEDEE